MLCFKKRNQVITHYYYKIITKWHALNTKIKIKIYRISYTRVKYFNLCKIKSLACNMMLIT